ncbi:MAG: VOC family protein [Candidatus Limiplasma sp.]|nr:VOC family protein [Candidatus Limiplasma sp.]
MDHGVRKPIALDAVVLECKDVQALADFYLRLLGWETRLDGGEEWVDILPPGGGVKLAFQQNQAYVPPVWPEEPSAQQQMAHLDFTVNSPEEMALAVEHALACGAALAQVQYGGEQWVTLLDPAEHPFCFVLWEA